MAHIESKPDLQHIKDLRSYINILKGLGQIQEINVEVDWNLEIGAVIRRSYDVKAPAPLFNKVKDKIGRALGAPVGVSASKEIPLAKLALSVGLPPNSTQLEIIDSLAKGFLRKPIAPQVISTCPAKKNMFQGDKIDLYQLPTPLIHGGDGGPYINTIGCIVVQTPDGSWTNWSIARIMINGPRSMTGIVAPTKHLGQIHAMWKKLGKDTPFVLALGVEPGIPYVCSMALDDKVNEADWLGGYFGEPIEVARCETNDLHVPATAEIIIEGSISATKTAKEGPMGEYSGYSTESITMPLYEVDALYYQDNPILPVVAAGVPIEEDHTIWGVDTSATNLYHLRQAGFPVKHCVHTWESCMHWMVVTVKSKDIVLDQYKTRKDMIDHLAKIVFDSRAGVVVPKIILVEDDIDPTNIKDVAWALATRCHPDFGYHFYDNKSVTNLVPYLQCGEIDKRTTNKIIFDCLFPENEGKRPHVSSFKSLWPKEIQDKVLRRWFEYGYSTD